MKRRTILMAAGTGFGTLLAPTVPAAHARTAPGIVLLDTLPQGTGRVRALGRPGLSGGSSDNTPVYWTGRSVHRVPFPADYGYGIGEVTAINRHGLMVGTVRFPGSSESVGFSHRPGRRTATILPRSTRANDVNDHGRIVGTGPGRQGLVWHGGGVARELVPSSPFQSVTEVVGINNAGTIVGAESLRPVVWPGGTSGPAQALLPTEPPEGVFYSAAAIDEHGRIVGSKGDFFADGQYETYWDPPYTAEGIQVPGLPGYFGEGYFHAISPTTGLVAGSAPTSFGEPPAYPPGTAEFWTGSGPIRALPRLDDDDHADTGADAAADNGTVGGFAVRDNLMKPVIWTGVR
ncbi:hypothetical protein [Streptomyces sp. NPDC026673]|uniref:hypothetical protein n=1 Tax=Streptomyces sp. NPDC026673 TaxID=3155724 RepID=UPI0033C9B1B2